MSGYNPILIAGIFGEFTKQDERHASRQPACGETGVSECRILLSWPPSSHMTFFLPLRATNL